MPPVRTLPAAKPVKTERTHEENQERAYIAASRRSDRSLEARIESARRASEIHKKRTGRALRVTEQDVVNEEMYEEEDDDLPAQYRRLTAHLRTNSMDFNRRLQAYVATQIATRGALAEQGGQGHFASQYPNAPHFAHYGMPQSVPTPMLAPQMIHRQPQQFRHSPYHIPTPGSTPQPRQRSSSELQTNYSVDANTSDDRRASMPVQALRSPPLQSPASQVSPLQAQSPSHPLSPAMEQMRQQQQPMFPDASYRYPVDNTDPSVFDYSNPLSMALPNDTQQLLYGSPFDFNGSFSYLTGGTQFPGGFNGYSYNPNPASKMQRAQSASDGPATTLAPAHALEAGFEATTDLSNSQSAIADGASASFSPGFVPCYDSGDQFYGHAMKKESSNLGSGTLTPSGEFFNSFISGYEEGNAA